MRDERILSAFLIGIKGLYAIKPVSYRHHIGAFADMMPI